MLVQLEKARFRNGGVQATVTGRFSKIKDLKSEIVKREIPFVEIEDFYLEHNGKILRDDEQVKALFCEGSSSRAINVVPRLLGGKGGFGSMLRAIGAQIEKTTNRDACRDLSGRRLRDINEEQRLKKWFAKQAEREKEKQEARKRKLEKLRQVADGPPLPKIDDQEFLQQREDIVEAVFEAVDEAFKEGPTETDALAIHNDSSNSSSSNQGAVSEAGAEKEANQACASSSSIDGAKDSASTVAKPERKAMKKTMFDEDLDSDSSSSEEEPDSVSPAKIAKMS